MSHKRKLPTHPSGIDMVRYHELVCVAIVKRITPLEREELDSMKAKLGALTVVKRIGELPKL